jgi:hypothetical protein
LLLHTCGHFSKYMSYKQHSYPLFNHERQKTSVIVFIWISESSEDSKFVPSDTNVTSYVLLFYELAYKITFIHFLLHKIGLGYPKFFLILFIPTHNSI